MFGVGKFQMSLVVITLWVLSLVLYGMQQRAAGREALRAQLSLQAAEARAENLQEIQELRNEIDLLSDDDFLSRLGEWVRDPATSGD